ncbi:MAG: hypothetical protein V1847_02080 [Candidatus Diapherotrites archaeon]
MELKEFTGKPCKSRLAFEFIPKKSAKLDLERTAQEFRSNEWQIVAETPFLVMVKAEGKESSVFKSGKIIVKDTQEERDARKVAEKLVKAFQAKE